MRWLGGQTPGRKGAGNPRGLQGDFGGLEVTLRDPSGPWREELGQPCLPRKPAGAALHALSRALPAQAQLCRARG